MMVNTHWCGHVAQCRRHTGVVAVCADASVSKELRLAITQARNAKGLTQKQLATQLNMQPQVINEYESGKAIPNNQVIAKIERALGAVRDGQRGGASFGTLWHHY